MQTLPINLSLSEDERSPNNRSTGSGSDTLSPQFNKAMAASQGMGQSIGQGPGTQNGHGGPMGSPLETADMLYEYFPLSVDDWYVYFHFFTLLLRGKGLSERV